MGTKRRRKEGRFKPGHAWLTILAVLFLAAIAFLAFANTLGNGFVFDDTTLILQSPQVVELRWGDIIEGGYRPVRSLTYALNVALGGLNPFGFHLFNVLLHAANVVLVFLVCRLLTGLRWPSFAAGILFAVHPVQTAAVAYISGRKDELATFFIFCGILSYFRFRRSPKTGWILLAGVWFALAFLSKEVAVVFPVLVILLEAARRQLENGERKVPLAPGLWRLLLGIGRDRPLLWLGSAALAAVGLYLALVAAPASRMHGLWGGTLAAHVGTSFKLFAHYLKLAIIPYPLMADYTGAVFPISSGLTEISTLFSFLLLLIFVVFAVKIFRKEPLISLGMIWFLVCLIPVLQLVPFHELAADHFLYLPIFGMALVVARGWDFLVRERKLDVVGWGLLTLIAGVFVLITVHRNEVWATPKSLWEATYETSNDSFRANVNLGYLYYTEGEWEKAVQLTERAIALGPGEALPYANLGAFQRERGYGEYAKGNLFPAQDLENQAVSNLEKAVKLEPTNPFNISNLGDAFKDLALIYDAHGEKEVAKAYRQQAENAFRWALSVGSDNPEFPLVEYKLGSVFLDAGDCVTALEFLPNAADRLPHRYQVQLQTGYCYFEEEMFQRSALYFSRALRAWPRSEAKNPQFREVFLGLGESYQRAGNQDKAIETYKQMLQVFPDSARANLKLAELYMNEGDLRLAGTHLQEASRLSSSPEISSMIQSLAQRLQERE